MRLNTLSVALVAGLAGPAAAFWRMPCPSRLIDERIDPIIFPGYVSAHVHTVAGGSGFGYNMTYEQARESACTSCPISQDLSAYWTPKLYYHDVQNGSFLSVPQAGDGVGMLGGMTVYYLQRPGPNNDVLKAFPEGFRMIAGNPFQRNYTGTFAAQAISYMCLDYSGTSTYTNELPLNNCPDGLRAQVFFPSCWDGVHLDSPDHSSHMAYPSSVAYNDGPCPASHPVHLISLFYEINYQTNLFSDMWYGPSGTQPFVFAMGDPTGYGFHGDFVNGWDIDVLQKAVTSCTDLSGVLTDCPYFDYVPETLSQSCTIPTYVQEDINGPMPSLPGCNPIQNGPEPAVNYYSTCTDKPTIKLDESYFTNVIDSLDYKYVGCGNDSVSTRTFDGASEAAEDMTVQKCVKFCSASGYTYAALEYSTQCYCGDTLDADHAPMKGVMGACNMACGGNASEMCGGPDTISIYEKCSSKDCSNNVIVPVGGKPIQEP